jgi:hypothetical protein
MTLDEIQTRILEAINDNPDSPVFFTAAQLKDLVNEANEVLCEDTLAVKRTAIVPLRPGMRFVYTPSIAPDIMAPTRIWNQSNSRKMTCFSMEELDALQERWSVSTGIPEVWFPLSWDCFGIYPTPVSAGGVLKVEYVAWPRELMDDEDRPELPEATHDALVLYGQYHGILKKWDANQAMIALKALQAHRTVAGARSGISRMNVRTFHRVQQPHSDFPAALSIGTRE